MADGDSTTLPGGWTSEEIDKAAGTGDVDLATPAATERVVLREDSFINIEGENVSVAFKEEDGENLWGPFPVLTGGVQGVVNVPKDVVKTITPGKKLQLSRSASVAVSGRIIFKAFV